MQYFVLFSLFFAFLQDQDVISASSAVSKNVLRIGDKLTYTITIEYDNSYRIQTPGQGANLGYFEIKDYKVHPTQQLGNVNRDVYEYTISTYDTGQYVIPPFPIGYFKKGQEQNFRLVEAPEQQLVVQSIFLNDSVVNDQPKDIKNVVEVPFISYLWAWIIFAVVVLIIGYFVYVKFFKKEPVVVEEKITPLQAHERAIAELERYRGFNSADPDEIDFYYTRLSFILRTYIEQRFHISAVEETTTELRESLRTIQITSSQYDMLVEHVAAADMVKFAKELPSVAEFERIFTDIYTFVSSTKAERVETSEVAHG